MTGWVNVDGSQEEERRAVSGYAFLIDGSAVLWLSKMQELVMLSTAESEYIAAVHAAKEAVYLIPCEWQGCSVKPNSWSALQEVSFNLSGFVQPYSH